MALYRVKCAHCGEVQDVQNVGPCPKCGNPMTIPSEAGVQIYRMGAFTGVAVGYGMYINDQPYGHIGNKQTVLVPLKYGTYKFHFTCGMTRDCDDIMFELSPASPIAYMKVHIETGFWKNKLVPELVTPDQMPPIQ